VAGLSISAPASRLDDAWLTQLQATARGISDTLGFAPDDRRA
jgi:DNA-binding IclR family transcriptional regulator